ncbi:MAG: hypothetical protein ABR907_02615 [Terracidiphilus sp.]|jgi:hypothetical protein
MSLSRRHFVQLASLSLLAGAAFPAALAQEAEDQRFSPENMAAFEGLSRQSFEPYIGERFSISLSGKSLGRLTLIEVAEIKPAAASQLRPFTAFSLRFQGSGGLLPQETYTLSQPAFGSFPLLLVPCAEGAAKPTYTAIFTQVETLGKH